MKRKDLKLILAEMLGATIEAGCSYETRRKYVETVGLLNSMIDLEVGGEPEFFVGWKGACRGGLQAEIFGEFGGQLFGRIDKTAHTWNLDGSSDASGINSWIDLIPNDQPTRGEVTYYSWPRPKDAAGNYTDGLGDGRANQEIWFRRPSKPDQLYSGIGMCGRHLGNLEKVSVQVLG